MTSAFIAMTADPIQLLSQELKSFALLERYTCVLYDKTTDIENVNDLRKDVFAKKSLSMETFLPHRLHCYSMPIVQFTSLAFGSTQ